MMLLVSIGIWSLRNLSWGQVLDTYLIYNVFSNTTCFFDCPFLWRREKN